MKQDAPIESEEASGWFDRPENVRKILIGIFVGCGLMLLIDLIFWISGYDKHPYLRWEKWPGFYGIFGFVACVVLALGSKFLLRPLVKRSEDHYEGAQHSNQGGKDA